MTGRALPAGWLIKQIKGFASVSYGFTAKATNNPTGSKFLRITDIQKNHVDWNNVPFCIVDDKNKKKHTLYDGDIVFARTGATTGKSYLVRKPPDAVCASYLIRLSIVDSSVEPSYLINYFQTKEYWDDISKGLSGSAQGGFNASKLSVLDIPIPPVSEQKRIVAILDEAFAGIDQAIANTERNLANARELFDSYLNEVFTQKGEGWEECVLSELCTVKDGTHDSPKYVAAGIPFVTQKNVKNSGLNFDKIKYISQQDHDKFYKRSDVAKGDILISMIGVNRGESCLVDDERVFSIKNVGLIKMNVQLNMKFLLLFLKSNQAGKYIHEATNGGAQPFIGLTKLRLFPVPVAPLTDQEAIVVHALEVERYIAELERIYQCKLEALVELKQSLLQKAFTGELTADWRKQAEKVQL